MCPVPENRTKIGRLIIGLCLVVIIISIIFTQTQEHRKQLDLDFETCRDKKIFQYEFKQAFYELEYVNIYKIGGKSEVSSNSQSRKKLSHGPMVNDQMLEFYNNYMKVSQSMLEYSEVWPKASLSKLDKLNIINLKKAANHLIRSNKNKSLYTRKIRDSTERNTQIQTDTLRFNQILESFNPDAKIKFNHYKFQAESSILCGQLYKLEIYPIYQNLPFNSYKYFMFGQDFGANQTLIHSLKQKYSTLKNIKNQDISCNSLLVFKNYNYNLPTVFKKCENHKYSYDEKFLSPHYEFLAKCSISLASHLNSLSVHVYQVSVELWTINHFNEFMIDRNINADEWYEKRRACRPSWINKQQYQYRAGYKSMAILTSLFFGGFGFDRFYLGYIIKGIFKLVLFGGLGVWTIIDSIYIMIGHLEHLNGANYVDHGNFLENVMANFNF